MYAMRRHLGKYITGFYWEFLKQEQLKKIFDSFTKSWIKKPCELRRRKLLVAMETPWWDCEVLKLWNFIGSLWQDVKSWGQRIVWKLYDEMWSLEKCTVIWELYDEMWIKPWNWKDDMGTLWRDVKSWKVYDNMGTLWLDVKSWSCRIL